MLGMPIPFDIMGSLRVGPPPSTIVRPRRRLERSSNVRGERIKSVALSGIRKHGDQEITSIQFGGIADDMSGTVGGTLNYQHLYAEGVAQIWVGRQLSR